MIPNGAVSNCQTCHVSPLGGSTRNAFGNAVNGLVTPNGQQQFWSAALAALDSDGDGFTNGQEMGDIDGDGTPERNTGISNPGDASSTPILPNTAPSITSTASASAFKGIAYSYQAVAADAELHSVIFAKVSGPAWLSVSANGLVSGTPPDDVSTLEAVTIRATDNGSPPESSDQSYNISVSASFFGWQRLNFSGGNNNPDAAAGSDGDLDQLPNFIEYATRGNPSTANSFVFPLGFDGRQHATLAIDIRDDDSSLTVVAERAAVSKSSKIQDEPFDPIQRFADILDAVGIGET